MRDWFSELSPSRFLITLKDAGVLAYAMSKRFPQAAGILQSPDAMATVAESIDRCAVASQPEQRLGTVLVALVMEMAAQGVSCDPALQSMRMPSFYSKLGAAACFCWTRLNSVRGLGAQVLLDIFERTGAFRDPRQLMIILDAWRFCNFPIAERERSLEGFAGLLRLSMLLNSSRRSMRARGISVTPCARFVCRYCQRNTTNRTTPRIRR